MLKLKSKDNTGTPYYKIIVNGVNEVEINRVSEDKIEECLEYIVYLQSLIDDPDVEGDIEGYADMSELSKHKGFTHVQIPTVDNGYAYDTINSIEIYYFDGKCLIEKEIVEDD